MHSIPCGIIAYRFLEIKCFFNIFGNLQKIFLYGDIFLYKLLLFFNICGKILREFFKEGIYKLGRI